MDMSNQLSSILAIASSLSVSMVPTFDLVATIISNMLEKKWPSEESTADNEALLSTLERQSKIIRELAISRPIDTAEKVTIEEFYEGKGEGNIGVQASNASLNVGLSGSGERVTKRIYTFEGWRDGGLKGIDEQIVALMKENASELAQEKVTVEEQE